MAGPRGIDESFYADACATELVAGVQTVLDADGEPMRLGLEAELTLVGPRNQREAEALVGQELNDEADFPDGARVDRRTGRATS